MVPGAGGTQRLPRLVGPRGGARDDRRPASRSPARGRWRSASSTSWPTIRSSPPRRSTASCWPPASRSAICRAPTPTEAAFDAARARARAEDARARSRRCGRSSWSRPAATTPLERGAWRSSARPFSTCAQGDQARALRHIFFAERGAKAPDWLDAAAAGSDPRGGGRRRHDGRGHRLCAAERRDLGRRSSKPMPTASPGPRPMWRRSSRPRSKRGLIDAAGAAARRAGFSATTD